MSATGIQTNGEGRAYSGHLNLTKTMADAGWHSMGDWSYRKRVASEEKAAKARPRVLGTPKGWSTAK